MREYADGDVEGQDPEGSEVVVQGRQGWLANSPWWLVSAGIHAVLLLGATLIAIEKLVAVDEGEVAIVVGPRNPPVISELERPRDVFVRRGIPTDDRTSQPSEEPVIFFPEAELSDHNESADNEQYRQMKGDSKDFLSYLKGQAGGFRGRQPGMTPGVYDTMGVGLGGGGGGRYGGRFGGMKDRVARGTGATPMTEGAVLAALKWLARHQSPDGGWSTDAYGNQCTGGKCPGPGEKDFSAGVTGLSLLAFLGAGYSHLSKPEPDPVNPSATLRFGEVVKNGLKWLMSHQDPEGCIGERTAQKYMYNHTLAALAISEAYGMTESQLLKEPAQKAVDFTVAAQNSGKGWRYSFKCGDNDSSVTGWAVMVLKSAELSELTFPRTAYDGTRNWYDEVTEDSYARVGYTHKGTGKVFVDGPNGNAQFDHHEALTAIGVMARIFMDKKKEDPRLSNGCNLLLRDKPKWDGNQIDYYYWYYATLALFQYDGPLGPKWRGWNEDMKNALVPNQRTGKDGCKNGSWDAVDRWSCEGGRVYATAINALTLEVYYRYANVFGAGSKP